MRQKILLLGSKSLGLKCLKAAVESLPDARVSVLTIDDRSDIRTALQEIQSYCDGLAIPFDVVRSREESEMFVHTERPTLCLVAGWYWLISRDALTISATSVPFTFRITIIAY